MTWWWLIFILNDDECWKLSVWKWSSAGLCTLEWAAYRQIWLMNGIDPQQEMTQSDIWDYDWVGRRIMGEKTLPPHKGGWGNAFMQEISSTNCWKIIWTANWSIRLSLIKILYSNSMHMQILNLVIKNIYHLGSIWLQGERKDVWGGGHVYDCRSQLAVSVIFHIYVSDHEIPNKCTDAFLYKD